MQRRLSYAHCVLPDTRRNFFHPMRGESVAFC
jgi:hypothetical protein